MKEKQRIRMMFRHAVFQRDGKQCKFCSEINDLDAHHIIDRNEMPNGGYVKENGITLCKKHHRDAEVYHESNGETYIPGFHPEDLFRKIGSSREIAEAMSEKLSSKVS